MGDSDAFAVFESRHDARPNCTRPPFWRRSLPVEVAPIQGRLRVTRTPRSHDRGRTGRGRERLAAASRRAAARAEHHATFGGVNRTRATDERCRHRDRTRRNPRREHPPMRPLGAALEVPPSSWPLASTNGSSTSAADSSSVSPPSGRWHRRCSIRRLATRFDRALTRRVKARRGRGAMRSDARWGNIHHAAEL